MIFQDGELKKKLIKIDVEKNYNQVMVEIENLRHDEFINIDDMNAIRKSLLVDFFSEWLIFGPFTTDVGKNYVIEDIDAVEQFVSKCYQNDKYYHAYIRELQSKRDLYVNNIKDVIEFVKGKEKLYVYGVGGAGKNIFYLLKKHDIKNIKFVVSPGYKKQNLYMGCEIYTLDEIESKSADEGMLVAVGEDLQPDIVKNLIAKQWNEFYCQRIFYCDGDYIINI